MGYIILAIKGFFIGLANLIPGVSGGTIAITLGIYDKLISSISNLTKSIIKESKFLFPIGIGMLMSILILSNVISYCLDKYVIATVLFFIGAIVGGIPMLYKKVKGHIDVKSVIIFLTTFVLVLALTFLSSGTIKEFTNMHLFDYLMLFIVGIIASATMVIPGVSGSAVLMTLGYYEPIINVIKDVFAFTNLFNSIIILIPFALGVILGIIMIAKIIEFLFKKYEIKTYYAILGFVISSIISIIIQNFNGPLIINIWEVIIGVILFGLGFVIAYKLGDK